MTSIAFNSSYAAHAVHETSTSSPMVNNLVAGVMLVVSLVLAATGVAIAAPAVVITSGLIAVGSSIALAWTRVFANEN